MAPPEQLRDGPAHRVAHHDDRPGAELVEESCRVVGDVGEPEPSPAADAASVPTKIGREHPVLLAQRLERVEPVQARRRDPSVEQDDRLRVRRTLDLAEERDAASGQVEPSAEWQRRGGDGIGRRLDERHANEVMTRRQTDRAPTSVAAMQPYAPSRTPAEAGIVDERLEALRARASRDIEGGLLPSCQLAVAKDGELVWFEAFGAADLATRYVIFSSTKPFVASVIWLLLGERALKPEMRVVDLVPEFGSNGKHEVTLDQVLLHTSGFPRAPLGPPEWSDRSSRLEVFSKWRLNWQPGSRHEYHATSAHWVLAEVIERVTGRDFRAVLHDRVTVPLGLRGFTLGVPRDEQGDVADLELRSEPPTVDEIRAVLGVDVIDRGEVTDEAMMRLNEPDAREVGVPGAGAVASAADVALFYQALLHDPDGLWDPEVLADATGTVRNTFHDRLTGCPANRSRGLVLAGDDGKSNLRGLGRTVSPRAFGHNGAGGQVAWADPESGLSFCYLTNGIDRHLFRQYRRDTAVASLAGSLTQPLP